jgi:hypothetical protein
MHPDRTALVVLLMILPMIPGCSGHTDIPASTSNAAAASGAGPSDADIRKMVANQNKPHPTACTLVTAAEMSAILGATVGAEPHEGTVDKTECIYKPANAPSPYAELTIDWEDGKEAMAVMGGMNKAEPGIADPYAGIGDKALATGPVLMVLNGDDMVTITFSGVDEIPSKARKVFDTAKPRMHPGH